MPASRAKRKRASIIRKITGRTYSSKATGRSHSANPGPHTHRRYGKRK